MSPREVEYNPAAVMALQEGSLPAALPIKGYSWIYPFDIIKDKSSYQMMIYKAIVNYATFASDTTGIPLENLTVIPIRPYDLGLSTVNWQVSLSNTGSTSPNLMLGSSGFTVPNNEFFVLLGMFDSTPDMLVDEIYIVRGQAKLYDAELDMLQPLPSSARFALFNKAFYFKPNDTFNVGLYAHSTGTEYLGLLGLLFTQNGQVITLS